MPERSAVADAEDLLASLGATPDVLTDRERDDLDRYGYVVLADLLTAAQVGSIRSSIDHQLDEVRRDGAWKARGTLHLSGVMDSGPEFDAAWTAPRLLAAVAHLVGPDFRVGDVHVRAPEPGNGAQFLHADGGRPAEGPHGHAGATAILALVDFTADNGATRVVPGSHLRDGWFEVDRRWGAAAIKRGKKSQDERDPDEQTVLCRAGSAIVFTAALWHSGTRNRGTERRDAFQIGFHRRSIRAEFARGARVSNETVDRLGDAALLLV